MKQLFELEWLGGVTEHHFRKVRPTIEDLPWGTLDPSKYAPAAVERARGSWTEVAINEYRAIGPFSEVLRALVEVRAPLDLIGMMQRLPRRRVLSRGAREPHGDGVGGQRRARIDIEQLSPRARGGTAWQRANELLLRVSCINEAFSGATAAVSCAHTTHELAALRVRDDPPRRGAAPSSRGPLLRVGALAHRRCRASPARARAGAHAEDDAALTGNDRRPPPRSRSRRRTISSRSAG